MAIQIGTSGWSYAHWQGILYPFDAKPWHRLGYYVKHFRSAELNSSFYRWPTTAAFQRWQQILPEGFQLSVKAPRPLTHNKRLYAPEAWLQRIGNCWHHLGDKRAVLLVQLSPAFAPDLARLRYFLELLPWWMRTAVEFRHPGWHREEVFQLLEAHGVAYCVMSGAGLPCVLRATAPFVYVRLHGPDPMHLYGGSYPEKDLRWWAERVREWERQGKDVYLYFNNDGNGYAVYNAATLQALLKEQQ